MTLADRFRSRRARWIAASLAVVAIAGILVARRTLGKPAMVPMHVAVERGDVVTNIEATGTVDAVTTVNVGAQVSGAIEKIHVDFNDPVQKGQVLAEIDDSKLRAALTQAEADMAAAQAAVRMAELGVETARADYEAARANMVGAQALERKAASDYQRAEQLYSSQVAAAAERDKLKSEIEGAAAQVRSQRALVEQAQARVANAQAMVAQARAEVKNAAAAVSQARTNLSYTVIRSPIDGTVVARNVEVGQTVATRLSAPNFFNIAKDLEHMYVYTKLDPLDVPRIKEGQRATFTIDAFPNRTWEGKVVQVRISPITAQRGQSAPSQLGSTQQTQIPGLQQPTGTSTPAGSAGTPSGLGPSVGGTGSSSSTTSGGGGGGATSGVANYDALVEFRNPDRRLLPGMTAYVTFPISAVYNVLRVRKEALRASPSISENEKRERLARVNLQPSQQVLWVVDGGTYKPVPVQTGTTDYVYVEITSGGVKEGQQVLAGYRQREP